MKWEPPFLTQLSVSCAGQRMESQRRAVSYVEGCQLDVWVLVSYAALQSAHGLFRLHRLGANDIGYLEVEGHVLPADGQQRPGNTLGSLGQLSLGTHKLDEVARSICSSRALFDDVPNQPAMAAGRGAGARPSWRVEDGRWDCRRAAV